MTTWRTLIQAAMYNHNETWNDVVANTLAAEELDVPFYNGFGAPEGKPFTLWTKQRVYFPTDYDGAEGVSSVPREPCDEPTPHVGGGGIPWSEGWDEEEREETRRKGWLPLPEQYRRTW